MDDSGTPGVNISSLRGSRQTSWKRQLADLASQRWETIRELGNFRRQHLSNMATYVLGDFVEWMACLPENSLHAIVTDPPYGLVEYNHTNHTKMRSGRGGVWRIPPSWDGAKRSPLPRFTVLSEEDTADLYAFFCVAALASLRALVPGGHLFIASNPLLSTMTFHAFQAAGFEKRGEVIRLVQTLRGGDRPKGAEKEFIDVTVMARSCWEPWGIFRKPFRGTVAENLRQWGTGALRRVSDNEPFRDVIPCSPTRGIEKALAPHPSLKPQKFLRRIVRAALPLGIGTVYDPFAGSGSTLAAAQAVGYRSIGTDRDIDYFVMSHTAFDQLVRLPIDGTGI